jgi:hypothetical protein
MVASALDADAVACMVSRSEGASMSDVPNGEREWTAEPLTAMSTLELQSHWGSGVILENVSIKPK